MLEEDPMCAPITNIPRACVMLQMGKLCPSLLNQSCNLKLHRLLYSFKVKNRLLHLCWQQRHLTSKNKCWENVCSLSSNRCIQNWPVKSLVCSWKLTTQNWFTCWNTKNRSRVKSKRPWLCFKPTKLSQLSKFLQEKKMKKNRLKSFFQEKRLSVVFCKHSKKEKEDKTETKKSKNQAKLNYRTIVSYILL